MVCDSAINTIFVNDSAVDFIGSPSFSTQLNGTGGGTFESDTYFVLAQFQQVEFRNVTGTPIFKGILTGVSYKFGPSRTASYKVQDYSFFLKRKIIYGNFEGTVDDVLMNVIDMSGTGPLWNPLIELGISGVYKKQFTGQHLGEALQSICQDYNLRYFIEPTGELRIRLISSEPELTPKRNIALPYNEVCGLAVDVIENIRYQTKFPDLSSVLVYGGTANDKFIKNFTPLDKNRIFDIPIESVNQHFELFEDCIAVKEVIMNITGESVSPGYYVTAEPVTTSTIYVSGCINYLITVTPVGGFTGDVDLSIVGSPFPSEVTYSFDPSTVTIIDETPVTSTLEVCSTTIDCYPSCSEAVGYFNLNASGGGIPSCPSCQTMYVTFKAYITNPESINCIGQSVTVEITNPGSDWWTASDTSISLTIGADLASATGVTVEFYPNGCDAEGCGPNNRSWVGPNGDCGSQNTDGGYSVTWPNGETQTGTYTVSDQGGC